MSYKSLYAEGSQPRGLLKLGLREMRFLLKTRVQVPAIEALFTNSGSWGNISGTVRRQTGTGEGENGQIVRCNAAWGG